MNYDIKVIRSHRNSYAISLTPDGHVVLKAPIWASNAEIEAFVQKHSSWIRRNRDRLLNSARELSGVRKLTQEELQELRDRANNYIPKRVAHYAPIVGVTYGRVTIRAQKTRWGSCSSKGNLNFNCLLMLAPADVIDSVVVHELCHRLEMNHSDRFYSHVLRVFPQYFNCDKWLKEKGRVLMAMMP